MLMIVCNKFSQLYEIIENVCSGLLIVEHLCSNGEYDDIFNKK